MSPRAGEESVEHSGHLKFFSALFYAGSSFLITVVNKTVLTGFSFPSFLCLGIGQMFTTVVVLYAAKMIKTVQFQDFDRSVLLKIFPLPLLYVGNHITGLASTKKLSLPMFTVLRKFTILMTMILEVYILRKRFPKRLVYSVMAIVFGAMVAASSDLAFDVQGYTFILLNDAFTAASNVYTKKNLGTEVKLCIHSSQPPLCRNKGPREIRRFILQCINHHRPHHPGKRIHGGFTQGTHRKNHLIQHISGHLNVSSLFEQAVEFADWVKAPFVFSFLMSCFMGFVLMYSIVLCSYYNSALTTTIVGAIKNVAVAYIGIFVGGDYLFSWLNFIGLSICMSGGLAYSYFTFSTKTPSRTTEAAHELKIHIPEPQRTL